MVDFGNRRTRDQRLCFFIALTLLVCSLTRPSVSAGGERLDFANVDLFSLSDWTSTDVSVDGLVLGMTREEVNRRKWPFKIVDPFGQNRKCETDGCELYSERGRPLGVSIAYGEDRSIREISVESYRPFLESGGAEWSQEVIARRLTGSTDQLLNNFSEDLRQRLLGKETRKEQKTQGNFSYVSAAYDQRGVVISCTIESNNDIQTVRDVTISFVPTKH